MADQEPQLPPVPEGHSRAAQASPKVLAHAEAVRARVEGATELSPEQLAFMATLKTRYERNQHGIACHRSIAWAKVEAKLSANPAKLDSLKKMDDSGGEPELTGAEGEEFLFDELAPKLPGSRALTYWTAVAKAKAMGGGAKLMRPERYEMLGNDMGIVMDGGNSWVWLDSENPHPKYGKLAYNHALYGIQVNGEARVGAYDAFNLFPGGGFRCSLRV
jgi:hypothetical protein